MCPCRLLRHRLRHLCCGTQLLQAPNAEGGRRGWAMPCTASCELLRDGGWVVLICLSNLTWACWEHNGQKGMRLGPCGHKQSGCWARAGKLQERCAHFVTVSSAPTPPFDATPLRESSLWPRHWAVPHSATLLPPRVLHCGRQVMGGRLWHAVSAGAPSDQRIAPT